MESSFQFRNNGSSNYHCEGHTQDGYATGYGEQVFDPHISEYNLQDWMITPSGFLIIPIFNSGGCRACEGSEESVYSGLE